jgi:hypothetical protein
LNVEAVQEEVEPCTHTERQVLNAQETIEITLAGLRARCFTVQQGGVIVFRVPESTFEQARAVWPIIQQTLMPHNVRGLLVSNLMTVDALDREDLLQAGLTRFGVPDANNLIVALVQASIGLDNVPVNVKLRDLLCAAAEALATTKHEQDVLEEKLTRAMTYEDAVLDPSELVTRRACHKQLASIYERTKAYFIAITQPGNEAQDIGDRFTAMRKQSLFARRFLLDTLIQEVNGEALGQPYGLLQTMMLYIDHILSALNNNDRNQISMAMQAMRETMLNVEKYLKTTKEEDIQH